MVDLAKTQAQFTAFFKKLSNEVAISQILVAEWARHEKDRTLGAIQLDQQAIYAKIDLAGQADIGVNTDINGFVYIRYTFAGTLTEVFKDSALGAGDLVASALTPDSVTTTLAEQNSSGLTAVKVTLNTGPFADDADIRVEITVDSKKRLDQAYASPLTTEEEKSKRASKDNIQSNIVAGIVGQFTSRRRVFEADVLLGFVGEFLNLTPTDEEAGAGVTYTYNVTGGVRLITDEKGVIAELTRAMADNTPAAQSVTQSTPTAGDLVARATNVGKLDAEATPAAAAINLVMKQHVRQGTIRIRCTSATVGRNLFSIENTFDEAQITPGRAQTSAAAIKPTGGATARIDKDYESGDLGVNLKLQHELPVLESGDDGAILSAVDMASINNTDAQGGTFSITIVRTLKITDGDSVDEFELRVFSTADRTTQVGVQKFTGIAGSDPINLTLNSGAVLTGTFDKAAADTKLPNKLDEDADIEFNLQLPQVGDSWDVVITHAFASVVNQYFAENNLGSIRATGAPTITESPAKFFPTLEG